MDLPGNPQIPQLTPKRNEGESNPLKADVSARWIAGPSGSWARLDD